MLQPGIVTTALDWFGQPQLLALLGAKCFQLSDSVLQAPPDHVQHPNVDAAKRHSHVLRLPHRWGVAPHRAVRVDPATKQRSKLPAPPDQSPGTVSESLLRDSSSNGSSRWHQSNRGSPRAPVKTCALPALLSVSVLLPTRHSLRIPTMPARSPPSANRYGTHRAIFKLPPRDLCFSPGPSRGPSPSELSFSSCTSSQGKDPLREISPCFAIRHGLVLPAWCC